MDIFEQTVGYPIWVPRVVIELILLGSVLAYAWFHNKQTGTKKSYSIVAFIVILIVFLEVNIGSSSR